MEGMRWVWGVVLAGAVGLGSAEAGPPERTVWRFKGLEGYATFSLQNDCSYPYFDVYAVEEMSAQGPGTPDKTRYVALFYSSYDFCAQESVSVYGETSEAVIRGSGVQSLHAEATVPVQECTYDFLTNQQVCVDGIVVLDLDWSANGEQSSHGQSTSHMSTPFFTVHRHSVGSSSTADVSGFVLLDGTDLLPGVAWSAGGLGRAREGSIEFTKH